MINAELTYVVLFGLIPITFFGFHHIRHMIASCDSNMDIRALRIAYPELIGNRKLYFYSNGDNDPDFRKYSTKYVPFGLNCGCGSRFSVSNHKSYGTKCVTINGRDF